MRRPATLAILVAVALVAGMLIGRRRPVFVEVPSPLASLPSKPSPAPPGPAHTNPAAVPAVPPAGAKGAPNRAALTPAMVDHIRGMMLQEVALRYSGYFAKARLSNEKAKLLLDLLVDQWTAGLEPGVQKGPSGEDPGASDLRMIKELIGEDGYRDLQDAGLEYAKGQAATETLGAVEKAAGPVAPESRALVREALVTIDPAAGTGDLITSGTEPTPDVQRQLHERQAAVLQAALDRIGEAMTPAQRQALADYVNAKAETSIQFAVMIWKAGHPGGRPSPGS